MQDFPSNGREEEGKLWKKVKVVFYLDSTPPSSHFRY